MAMFADLHCGYGIEDFKKMQKRAGGKGASTFEEATAPRVQCLMMAPLHQNRQRMASIASGKFLNALNHQAESTLNIFWF
jgi:hypothetical protein